MKRVAAPEAAFPWETLGKLASQTISLPCLVGLLLTLTWSAHAETRVALVIGNSSYQNTATLSNPVNDAEDFAGSLERLGFTVMLERNLDKRAMELAIARFSRLAREADAALFYYAGHGVQHRGLNYLMPTDARLEDEYALHFEMTRVEDVLYSLERARGVKILILDSCRNNPLADKLARASTSRDGIATRGLARIEAARGMITAYATQPNQTAMDGSGRNSPFTATLVQEMEQPGVEIGTLFRRVAAEVHRVTKGQQLPEVQMALLGEFYFNKRDTDVQAWSKIRDLNDIVLFNQFIGQYPTSALIQDARDRLVSIERAGQERATRERRALEHVEPERAEREGWVREQAERERVARAAAETKEWRARIAALEEEAKRRARNPLMPPTNTPPPITNQATTLTSPSESVPQPPSESGTLEDNQAGGLFRLQDAQIVKAIGKKHQFILPEFKLEKPETLVPVSARRFLGIWASDVGFGGGGRQWMLIVTRVESSSQANGFYVFGPPTPKSFNQNPANYRQFAGTIEGDELSFNTHDGGRYIATFTTGNRLKVFNRIRDGRSTTIVINPLWRLVEAERSVLKSSEGSSTSTPARGGKR